MNKIEFDNWLWISGYTTINDWNYQEIGADHYYFIKHKSSGLYALIKETPAVPYNMYRTGHKYKVLVEDWVDFNGWDKDDYFLTDSLEG